MALSPLEVRCAGWIFVAVSLGALLAGCEVLYMRKDCADRGLFSWPVGRSSYRFALGNRIGRILDAFCNYPQYIYVVVLQVLCAVALLFHLLPRYYTLLFLTILCVHLLSMLRYPQGADGTDQMQTILLASLACYYATPDPLVKRAAIWFISLQVILAYFTSGIAKLLSKPWREGTVLKSSLLLAPGSKTIYQWLPKSRRLNQFLCLGVIFFECAFPLALIGPRVCLIFLVCGVLLHVFNAFALSIPRFLFTFPAAYPAILVSTIGLHPGWAASHLLWMQ